ncbi:MAG: hypothetical protein MJZ06_02815 [Bacteroidaceae bacterium]|nr:hypothetical protein [Bacteroidaceae bacterium]
MVNRWATNVRRGLGDDEIARAIAFMRKYDNEIVNPATRAMLVQNMAAFCFVDIDIDSTEIYEPLFAEFERFAPDIPKFFLIDADGRFIDADCARPSSDGIESIIESAFK